ncbi:MAG: glycerophosphodiester phosphodiesterase [Bradyrhizobium sp.]|nr:MAG: glycerophosphodiester phosphodiesterase [Bradyrhizobium sp.]
MSAPAWLIERPIAHRGLHDARRGLIENTLGAAEAAIGAHCAIECDVQLSRDGEAMVFHDDNLRRLAHAGGALSARSLAELRRVALRGSDEGIPTLPELLARIAGRTPLICELKSCFDGDMSLADRVAAIAKTYSGPLALKSFDPAFIAHLRQRGDLVAPLGVVAQADYSGWHWRAMSAEQKRDHAAFAHISQTRPDFLSWSVDDLPHPTPMLLRALSGLPVMVWTVRTPAQRRRAAQFADQIIFEGAPH